MIAVTKIIQELKNEVMNCDKYEDSRIIKLEITPEQYKEMFILNARKELIKKGIKIVNENNELIVENDYIIDNSNKEVINQLFYYLVMSPKFIGEQRKGIMLAGSIGAGKTIIMNVLCEIIEQLSDKLVTRLHSKRIAEFLKEKPSGYLDKRPIFIDDLGRESKEVNNYGTKELPIIDLMSIRYDNGALTFATTNFNFEKLSEFYGVAIADRFKEMFNFIELIGESKRK